jgi:hypothetical protein
LVDPAGVRGEGADDLAGGGVDDPDVVVVDQQDDRRARKCQGRPAVERRSPEGDLVVVVLKMPSDGDGAGVEALAGE